MRGMRTRVSPSLALATALVAISGCATSFTGDAHVPGGANGCQSACAAQGLDMAGMVLMGEYSDGCICKVRGRSASTQDERIAVAAGPAAVGVVMAMRAQNQQQRQQQQMQMQQH